MGTCFLLRYFARIVTERELFIFSIVEELSICPGKAERGSSQDGVVPVGPMYHVAGFQSACFGGLRKCDTEMRWKQRHAEIF
jgi:hypothetical protein